MNSDHRISRVLVKRILPGEDLLKAVAAWMAEENVEAGMISIIGALSTYRVGYWDQRRKTYITRAEGPGDWEILHCAGNVSMKDGAPFPHLHLMISGEDYQCFGGHVFEGCTVFVAECIVQVFDGPALERRLDPVTGLVLWPTKD